MHANTIFPPTRIEALTRLRDFTPCAGRDYAARRNYDLGPGRHAGVSTLSPYIRTRLITEQDVLQSVLAKFAPSTAEKFIQEVFWRTYWKGWLEMRPGVWRDYRQELGQQINNIQTQSGLRRDWTAACQGETGIDCFDAWARELVQTGYLHNHARMWFASIWIFTLRLPWVLGADFFLRHLLDGDPASNTLSWRWVGGLHTQGKTYLARTSNISKYTEGRFHPKWQLASEALPLKGSPNPDRQPLPDSDDINPDLRTGLLLHPEDLSLAYLWEGCSPPQTVCILHSAHRLSPLHLAPHIKTFHAGALQDCVARYDLSVDATAQSAEDINTWIVAQGLDQVVTAYAPVGPSADILAKLSRNSTARVVQVQRAFDQAAWPHATHGFFRFKEHIPSLLKVII
ncbi:MAG: FAD-binding domain-containing protein [Paracoccaceae bacterium]